MAGLARQEYNLELRRYDGQGWRAMFFPSEFEHSLIPRRKRRGRAQWGTRGALLTVTDESPV